MDSYLKASAIQREISLLKNKLHTIGSSIFQSSKSAPRPNGKKKAATPQVRASSCTWRFSNNHRLVLGSKSWSFRDDQSAIQIQTETRVIDVKSCANINMDNLMTYLYILHVSARVVAVAIHTACVQLPAWVQHIQYMIPEGMLILNTKHR